MKYSLLPLPVSLSLVRRGNGRVRLKTNDGKNKD